MTRHYCKRAAMPRLCLALAVCLLITGLTACDGNSLPDQQLAPGQGEYLRWCGSCHGNAGEGKPPAFPPLAGSEWLELPDRALAMIVLHGLRGEIEVAGRAYRGFMPPMRHLSDEDIAVIIEFVLSSWSDREPLIDAEQVSDLRKDQPQTPFDGYQDLMQRIGMRSNETGFDEQLSDEEQP